MKIVQIVNGIVYYDMTPVHPTLRSTEGRYPSDMLIVEAPDYVFEGWGYDGAQIGDERFIQPTPPEGWYYDPANGTFTTVKTEPLAESGSEANRTAAPVYTLQERVAAGELTAEQYKSITGEDYEVTP